MLLAETTWPDLWVANRTGEALWSKQREILNALLLHKRVAVASCNAAGKSYLAGRAAGWFLHTFSPSIVITTAPTDRQVRLILWKEIHLLAARAKANGNDLGGTLLTKEWQIGEDHLAYGFATRDYDATAFQGIHAPYVLVIADEAAGLTESIWSGIFGVLRGGYTRLLAIGNPTVPEGRFFEAFEDERYESFHISAFDTPNLTGEMGVPGLITAEDVADAEKDWGEDSPLYQAYILGRFPDVTEDTLISMGIVQAAGAGEWTEERIRLEVEATRGRGYEVEVGMDAARYGTNENVMTARIGPFGFASESFGAKDLGRTGMMAATGRLVEFSRRVGARKLKVDEVGLGGGIPDRLRELQEEGRLDGGIEVVGMNAGGPAEDPERYYDAGTEWWAGLADRLRAENAYGPVFKNKRLLSQLSRRKYRVLSDGRRRIEPKEDLRKRKLPSPDHGDAAAFAYAETRANPFAGAVPTGVGGGQSYWRSLG